MKQGQRHTSRSCHHESQADMELSLLFTVYSLNTPGKTLLSVCLSGIVSLLINVQDVRCRFHYHDAHEFVDKHHRADY